MQHCIDNLEVNGGVVVEGKRNGGEEALVSVSEGTMKMKIKEESTG